MKLAAFSAAIFASAISSTFALTVPVAEDTSISVSGASKLNTPNGGIATRVAVNSKHIALVRFDLTQLDVVPAVITPANIKSAILRFYAVSTTAAADLTIHAVTSAWSDRIAANVAAPSIDPTVLATIPAADLGNLKFVSVDLTAAVSSALQSGSSFGFAIETSDPNALVVIASREGPSFGEAAQLDIDADFSSGGSAGNGTSITLSGNLTLPTTTASAGILYAGKAPLLQDFGGANIFVGGYAGNFTTTGISNAAVGYEALHSATSGGYNAALGSQTLSANTTGVYNTACGFAALYVNTTGFSNTGVGAGALQANTIGYQNTASSDDALNANVSGNNNTASGYAALFLNQSGNNNTATGVGALYSTSSSNGTATGYDALFSNTTGAENVANGYEALYSTTTGSQNTAIGGESLYSNSIGNSNVSAGYQALHSNTTGSSNIAAGFQALYSNTTGGMSNGNQAGGNVALGYQALFSNTAGEANIAMGHQALYYNTGNGNIGFGQNALGTCTTGNYNVAIGIDAGGAVTTGSYNIHIGTSVVGSYSNSDDHTIRIGSAQTKAYVAGIWGTLIDGNGAQVYATASGNLGTNASSRRFKEDIEDIGETSDGLLALRPVTFHYKTQKPESDGHRTAQFGLIAEEVAEINPDLVLRDADGEIFSVRYEQVNAMLLNEFLKEHRRVGEQETRLAAQEERLAEQQKQIRELTESIAAIREQLKTAPEKNSAAGEPTTISVEVK